MHDIVMADLAGEFAKRIKYSLKNELSRLNTSYSFKVVRIAEFTLNEIGNVSKIGKAYGFVDLDAGGQKVDFLDT